MKKPNDIKPHRPTDDIASEAAKMRLENRLLKRRVKELEQLVVQDTLTPLFNRRHFMEVLERWSWRAHRYGGNYGIIFLDVDGLKDVNDSLGHGAGDKLLIAVANVLLQNIRRSDVAARLGGDEFAVMLDNADASGVAGKAQKLRCAVGDVAMEIDGQVVTPTVSVGHAMIGAGKSAEEILLEADRAMYAQKQSGKGPAGGRE